MTVKGTAMSTAKTVILAGQLLAAVVALSTFLIGAYTQFLGPGLKQWGQDFFGITEIHRTLTFIETNMEAPRVAVYHSFTQIGGCDLSAPDAQAQGFTVCRVVVDVSRTEYGKNCGRPSAVGQLRLNGRGVPLQVELPDFEAVEATPRGVLVEVPLKMYETYGPGTHAVRFENKYPSCEWSREPIPRHSPWFDLVVTD